MQFLLLLEKFPIIKKILGVLTLGLTWWASIKIAENRGEDNGKKDIKLEQAEIELELIKQDKERDKNIDTLPADDQRKRLQSFFKKD